MCPGQDDTDSFCLVLTDLAAQPGGVNSVLYRLGTVGHSFRESDQFPVEMCPVCISICRNIFLPLFTNNIFIADFYYFYSLVS